jgi:hypothetical protein
MKRAKPQSRLTGKKIPSHKSFQQVLQLQLANDVPRFEPGPLAHTLLLELEKAGKALSDKSYLTILRVAASLKRQHYEETASELETREVVRKAMAAKSKGATS